MSDRSLIQQNLQAGSDTHWRAGLTMVELLVAITLAATLMAAMTSLLRSLRQPLRHAEQTASPLWPGRLASQLRQDLLAASGVHRQDDTIWITGKLPSASRPGSSSATVGYTSVPSGQSSWALVRIDQGGFEVFAIGPRRLLIERVDEFGLPQPLPPLVGPVPSRVRLWVFDADPDQPEVVRDIVLW